MELCLRAKDEFGLSDDALRALGFKGVFATGSKLDAITDFSCFCHWFRRFLNRFTFSSQNRLVDR